MNNTIDRIKMAVAMIIFGTIGLFSRYLSLPTAFVAFSRGILGTFFIFLFVKLKGIKISKDDIKNNGIKLIVSGALIGINWVLLFESYRHTTVATATVCYYLAPVFVLIASPFVLRERMTIKKVICIIVAFAGMVLVSGVADAGGIGAEDTFGIIFGCSAAVCYAIVILINRFIKDISAYDKTMVQLLFAAIVLIPYLFVTIKPNELVFDLTTIGLLLIMGILHTGFTYTLYFGSMGGLETHTIALFSYLDPVVAIIMSALVLREPMSLLAAVGTVMVLGSTLVSELNLGKKKEN